RNRVYPAGFSVTTTLTGEAYTRPANGTSILNLAPGTLSLSGADLSAEVDNQISVDGRNRVTNMSDNKLSLSFSVGNGTFRGRVIDPSTSKPISFSGVVLQADGVAQGYYLNTSAGQSGRVLISPTAQ
ncbi:MAG TPA: hypothetical protein VG897_16895, partial [Terriglobales bacterium]|nr:hypothetical protein [Terriglobales bacterium]